MHLLAFYKSRILKIDQLSKIPLFDDHFSRTDNRRRRSKCCISTALIEQLKTKAWAHNLLSDSNTNVNSMINRRVSLFYRYPLEASHHIVCQCTSYGVCAVCPGTSELVGQLVSMTLNSSNLKRHFRKN